MVVHEELHFIQMEHINPLPTELRNIQAEQKYDLMPACKLECITVITLRVDRYMPTIDSSKITVQHQTKFRERSSAFQAGVHWHKAVGQIQQNSIVFLRN